MKLLVKYPTRSRPSQFLNTLGLYRSMKSGKHCVEFVVSADANDFTMNNGAMRDTLGPMPDVALCVGNSRTKIEAVNADMEGREFDVLLLASDDMIPVVHPAFVLRTDGYDPKNPVFPQNGWAVKTVRDLGKIATYVETIKARYANPSCLI